MGQARASLQYKTASSEPPALNATSAEATTSHAVASPAARGRIRPPTGEVLATVTVSGSGTRTSASPVTRVAHPRRRSRSAAGQSNQTPEPSALTPRRDTRSPASGSQPSAFQQAVWRATNTQPGVTNSQSRQSLGNLGELDKKRRAALRRLDGERR